MKFNIKYPKIINDKNFISGVKPSSGIFPERLTLNLYDTVALFDLNKESIEISNVHSKMSGKFLFHISHIWVNEYNWGCAYNVVQIIIDPNISIKEYSFIEEEEEKPKLCVKDDPKYAKYFKMLSMGIPKPAIKQKIILDRLDPNIIDKDPTESLEDKVVKEDVTQRPANLLLEIKKGFSLKKTEPIIKKKKCSYTYTNLHVPTLNQIKNAKLSLRKIPKDIDDK